MKVEVTTYIKPLHWDVLPDEVAIYDLNNEMQRTFFIRDITQIDPNEYKTIQKYEEKEKEKL